MVRRTGRDEPAPSRVFVDSSGWFAIASASDGRHAEAERLLREAVARQTGLVTTNLVVAEVHRLALVRMGIRPAAALLDRIEASRLVSIVHATADHHRLARRWLVKLADQPISYADAVSFAVMETGRCRVALTFDRHFAMAGFRMWQVDA
ncbi:MAG TPA: PIN domain-containing protein [Candidatus Eisenbacteria bacterium]|nr:PIN domain-containing protein [Candidatus Eisenbacteria bacterium]